MTSRALIHRRQLVSGPGGAPDGPRINIVLLIDAGATEARTAAVIEAGVSLPTGLATGIGTDCIAIACDPGDTAFARVVTRWFSDQNATC